MGKVRQSTFKLSRRKKAMYGCAVTCGLFIVLECVLALLAVQPTLVDRDPYVGFEASIPLFEHQLGPEGVFFETAKNKLAYFNAQRFPQDKAENAFRVFCIGGSTTYGRPYDDSTSYVSWLRELLPTVDESRPWEVINAGGISYASYRLAALVDELVQYEPDLLVFHTGHNEFLEERTYRDLLSQPASYRRAMAWLHRTRTFSLLDRLWNGEQSERTTGWVLPAEVDAILDHTAGPSSYQHDAKLQASILQHFEFNLRRIVHAARRAGAKVLLVTPAANGKDFSPFKSEHSEEFEQSHQTEWADLFAQAMLRSVAGELEQALSLLFQAERLDDGRADLHFEIGRILFQQGEYAAARDAFAKAIDHDICPLRAISAIQASVERTAASLQVPLIDFDSILRTDCQRSFGHDSLGNEYFLDHVHPNIEAHRLLAIALLEGMRHMQLVHPNGLWREAAIARCSRIIESRIDPALQSRALTNLAQVLSWAGKQEEAGPLAAQAVRLRSEHGLEEDPESLFYFAVHLQMLGSLEEAAVLLEKVVQYLPRDIQSRKRLAMLLYDLEQYEQAKLQFLEAVRLAPSDALVRHMLGVVLLELKEYEAALSTLRRALQLDPDNPVIRQEIDWALQRSGRLPATKS